MPQIDNKIIEQCKKNIFSIITSQNRSISDDEIFDEYKKKVKIHNFPSALIPLICSDLSVNGRIQRLYIHKEKKWMNAPLHLPPDKMYWYKILDRLVTTTGASSQKVLYKALSTYAKSIE